MKAKSKGKILAPGFGKQEPEYWEPEKKVWVWFLYNWSHDKKNDYPLICDKAYENKEDAYDHFWSDDEDMPKDAMWSEIKHLTVAEFLDTLIEMEGLRANPFQQVNLMEFLNIWILAFGDWVDENLELEWD